MNAYYGFDYRGRTIIYVPNNLIGIGNDDDFHFDWDPDTLQGIALLFNKELIWEEDFSKERGDICRVDIPDYLLRGFRDLCFRNMPYERKWEKAKEITDYAGDLADFHSSLRREPE